MARRMVEVISFHRPVQLTSELIGEGSIAPPPTPAIAGPDMDPQFSGNAPRGTRQAQEKGGEHPVHHRALAAVQERAGEVIEGAFAALLFATVTFQSGLGVVRAPRTDVETLTAGA